MAIPSYSDIENSGWRVTRAQWRDMVAADRGHIGIDGHTYYWFGMDDRGITCLISVTITDLEPRQ